GIGPRATIRVMRTFGALVLLVVLGLSAVPAAGQPVTQEYSVPSGSHPHDVAPATDGGVWFTAQAAGYLGWLDPATGDIRQIALGPRSAPHGVIVGPDGAPWVTDGGLNAIVRVDPVTQEVKLFPLPADRPNANLNTAVFDKDGRTLWFTGQNGVFGRLDTQSGAMAVFVDDADVVWVTEWDANALVRFDPARETFVVRAHPAPNANVRQLLGRHGEVWGAMSGQDKLVVARPAG